MAGNRDAHLPYLASSVNNHAIALAGAGRRAEALPASEEAVSLYRELVEGGRDAYLPDLAMSVNNYAVRLAEAGRRVEALAASEEAVALRRELVEGNRDAYVPDLAGSLWGTGCVCVALDESSVEAIAAAREGLGLYAVLAATEPDAFTDRLHSAAETLADLYEIAGDPEAAAAVRAEYGPPPAS
ncbi:hypothetical protein GCM10023263_41250 [Phytohabitans rumicis]